MAKRLFSSSPRAEVILADLRARDENVSGWISKGVVDATIPLFTPLRHDALHLLDLEAGLADEWDSTRRIDTIGQDELRRKEIYNALRNGLYWLSTHPIDKCTVLEKIFKDYDLASITVNDALNKAKEIFTAQMHPVLQKRLADLTSGEIVQDILQSWDLYWNEEATYLFLAAYIENVEASQPFEILQLVKLLQEIEVTYIMRLIE